MSVTTNRILKWALSIVSVALSTLLVVTLESSRQHEMRQMDRAGVDSVDTYSRQMGQSGGQRHVI